MDRESTPLPGSSFIREQPLLETLRGTLREEIEYGYDHEDSYFHTIAKPLRTYAGGLDTARGATGLEIGAEGEIAQALRTVWFSEELAVAYMRGYRGQVGSEAHVRGSAVGYEIASHLQKHLDPSLAYAPYIEKTFGTSSVGGEFRSHEALRNDLTAAGASEQLIALVEGDKILRRVYQRIKANTKDISKSNRSPGVKGSEFFWRGILTGYRTEEGYSIPGQEGVFFDVGYAAKAAMIIKQKAAEIFGEEEVERGLQFLRSILYMRTTKYPRTLKTFRQPVFQALVKGDFDGAEELLLQEILRYPDAFTHIAKRDLGITEDDITRYQQIRIKEMERLRAEREQAQIEEIRQRQEQRKADTSQEAITRAEKLTGHLLVWVEKSRTPEEEITRVPLYVIVLGKSRKTPQAVLEVDAEGRIVKKTGREIEPFPAVNLRVFDGRTGEYRATAQVYPGTILREEYVDLGEVSQILGGDFEVSEAMEIPLGKITQANH